jgi:hypothetical protein
MKKRHPIGIAVFILAMGLVLLGCPTDTPSGPETKTYEGITGDDSTYELVITDDTTYVLTVTGSDGSKKTNTGTVTSSSGGQITLKPEAGADIIVSTASGGIVGIEVEGGGSISVKDETGKNADPVTPPGEITAKPPAASPGSITFTGINSRYNGQYAAFRSSSSTPPTGGDYLMGGSSITSSGITGVRINGGSVTIPVYLVHETSQTGTSYNGSDKNIRIYLNIKDSASFAFADLFGDDYEGYTINSVNFTNGGTSVNVGGGGNTGKTLIITDITAVQAGQGQSGFMVGIFQAGTTPEDAFSQKGLVTGADSEDVTLSSSAPYTATVSLSDLPDGTYVIYLMLGSESSVSYYQSQNVSFTSALTSVSATTFSPLQTFSPLPQ